MPYNPPDIIPGERSSVITGDFWVLMAMLIYFIVVVLVGFVYAKR